MSVPAGTVVAGYTVERVLGVGGMGTVYLARHPVLPRSDALKVLSEELSADPEFEARFLREADIAATLDHPNIVRVYTRGETQQGQLWIAMQFIDGTDAGAVSKRGPIPPQRAAHIVAQVARALDYAHARGVLHRDIKPANFLLSGEVGPRERVLLADFGIARALSEATRLTATGTLVSTVAYTAPEMLEGGNADHRADVYSLGCALYRMLTNRTPFGGVGADSSVSAVLVAHLTEPPPRATATVPNLPPAIDNVIAKAMAKDPDARYQSAREFAAAAAGALGYADTGRTFTQPGAAALDNPGTQPWLRAGPVSPPAPIPTTGPTAPARGGGSVLPPPGWQGPGPSAERYPTGPTQPRAVTPVAARRQRGRRRWIYAAAVVSVVAASVGAYLYTKSPSLPPYPPQTFTDAFGTTKIDHRPNAVAALSLADADVVLSLGVQPVAISNGLNSPPSWLAAMVNGHPTVVKRGDLAAVKAANPDVIIDTAANQKIYNGLTAMGPTVARPSAQGSPWNTRAQIDWIGKVLGLSDAATKLNDRTAARQAEVRQANSAFTGKRIKVVNFTDSGLTVDLSASPAATFLSGLGFGYDADYTSQTPEALEQPITAGSLYKMDDDDVTIVVRVDKKAANGGFDGLPDELLAEMTQLIVIDNTDLIAALVSGGPAATDYLDDHFVSILKDKVR